MNRSTLCVALVLLLAANFSVRTSYSLTVRGMDYSARQAETYVELPSGSARVNYGESRTFKVPSDSPITVVRRAEIGWTHIPTKPSRRYHISLRDGAGVKTEPMLFVLAMFRSRRVLLNYPPVSSVWHLPAGVAQLAAVLRSDGHEVVQRYGHIIGLEYVLERGAVRHLNSTPRGRSMAQRCIEVARGEESNIHNRRVNRDLLRLLSFHASAPRNSWAERDAFSVERNNVFYVSAHYDGTVRGVLEAVHWREQNMWYEYFQMEEVPLTFNFRPDVYGISVADERQLIQSCILARMIKKALPETLVVLGGNFWSRVTGVFQLPEFAEFFDHCDAIVYREGFQPLQQLAATLNPAHAPGVAWRKNGEVVVNPATQSPTDFETLPTPAFDGGARQWAPDFVPS
ncbi:MAG: hypothetical protein HYU35_01765, partial [Parcubacteria group bacterium]|nr:hypothetical protein [Parcubacteria group bacterium]